MAGTLWQMATPVPDVAALYREEPLLAHAVVEVELRPTYILTELLRGYLAGNGASGQRAGARVRPASIAGSRTPKVPEKVLSRSS